MTRIADSTRPASALGHTVVGVVPTFLLLGVAASVARKGWVVIVLASVAFAIYLPFGGRFSDSGHPLEYSLGGGLLVAVNGAVGFGFGRGLKWVFERTIKPWAT